MSARELTRVEVVGRVKAGSLVLVADERRAPHSTRSARNGSTRDARQAGPTAAAAAITKNTAAAPVIVHGSCAETPKRSASIQRVATSVLATPSARPATTGRTDSRTTIRTTSM